MVHAVRALNGDRKHQIKIYFFVFIKLQFIYFFVFIFNKKKYWI